MSNLGDANNVFAFRCATIEIDGDALRPARQKVKISVRFDPQLIAMIGDRAMYEVTLEALPGGAE